MPGYIPRDLLDQYRPDQSDPTYRMSMLPFGTYPNADGQGEHLGLAVPGMVQEPVNALMRLMGTPANPGSFAYGPDYGHNADDMRTLLETFTGGNAGTATARAGATGLRDTAQAAYRNFRYGAEPTAMEQIPWEIRQHAMSGRGDARVPGTPENSNVAFERILMQRDHGQPGDYYFSGIGGDNLPGRFDPDYFNSLMADNGRPSLLGSALSSLARPSPVDITPETAALMTSPSRVRVQPSPASEYRVTADPSGSPGDSLTRYGRDFWDTYRPGSVDDHVPYNGGFHTGDGVANEIESLLAGVNDAERLGFVDPASAAAQRDYYNRLRDHVTNDGWDGSLFSDTSRPSLWGSAVAGAEHGGVPEGFFKSNFTHNGNPYDAVGRIDNGIADVRYMGGNELGEHPPLPLSAIRDWRNQFLKEHPEVTSFKGDRISGAKDVNDMLDRSVSVPALFSDTSRPSLWGSALQDQDQYPNSLFNF